MQKLLKGVLKSQNRVYPQYKALLYDLTHSQTSRNLSVICVDDCINSSPIAQTEPSNMPELGE